MSTVSMSCRTETFPVQSNNAIHRTHSIARQRFFWITNRATQTCNNSNKQLGYASKLFFVPNNCIPIYISSYNLFVLWLHTVNRSALLCHLIGNCRNIICNTCNHFIDIIHHVLIVYRCHWLYRPCICFVTKNTASQQTIAIQREIPRHTQLKFIF